jgi:hypothetical protein
MEKMEKPKEKITPQSVLEDIRNKYPGSREFMQAVVDASKNSYAHSGEGDVNSVVVKLGSIRTSIFGRNGEGLSPVGAPVDPKQVEKIYGDAVNFGFLVSAVYHGEATFIGDDGSLLGTPKALKSQ